VGGAVGSDTDVVAAWAGSGAMALTGRPDGVPLGPPSRLVPGLRDAAAAIAADSAGIGRPVTLDPLALLGERAALRGLRRGGDVSCGGHARLLRTADDWLAVSLARTDDIDLISAWLELSEPPADPWATVAARLSTLDASTVVERGRLLGLPVARLGAVHDDSPVRVHQVADHPPCASIEALTVVDLSALWAGPLSASLLQLAGARVVKVESLTRPDGLRRGDPALFDLLNAGKQSVSLDLRQPSGLADLRRLLAAADVVIESSRPRALEQWGIRAADILAESRRLRVWLSITGYGRGEPERNWVAFGDDAAVAGGLVGWDAEGPCFCADAVADPTTGLVAAAACLSALRDGGRWLLDVAMARVAASLAGPTVAVTSTSACAPPRSRPARGPARPPGADTVSVLSTMD
jgi:crotonobetainyl-CoA:carnitine CoA-transferase CaiB-like acyl-CoA transferase